MSVKMALVFEKKAAVKKAIAAGLKKAGLKVSAAEAVSDVRKEGLAVLGPSVAKPKAVAEALRERLPDVLVLAAQKTHKTPAWADGVLPLPVSAADLKVRLPELERLRELEAEQSPLPQQEPLFDPLTNFYTFSVFKELLYVEVKRARRYGFPLAVSCLAFDNFEMPEEKELRAQLYGGLALAVRRSLRDTDFPVQYSPERVLLLMPHTDLQGALVVSRRICERVGKASLTFGDRVLHPTISVGVSAAEPGREFSFSDLLKHALEGLEEARGSGGNRVEFVTSVPGISAGVPQVGADE